MRFHYIVIYSNLHQIVLILLTFAHFLEIFYFEKNINLFYGESYSKILMPEMNYFNGCYFVSNEILNSNYTEIIDKTREISRKLVLSNLYKKWEVTSKIASDLGMLYRKKKGIKNKIFASGLYNYALVNAKYKQPIKKQIAEIEQEMLFETFNRRIEIDTLCRKNKENREKIQSIRREVNRLISQMDDFPDVQEIVKIEDEILKKFGLFLTYLVNQVLEMTALPPCEYAIIAFGSFANKLMTHYSDIEFAILISEDTKENKQYFEKVSNLLELFVINLGETILPTLGIPYLGAKEFYDNSIPRGFAFDGLGIPGKGGMVPMGDREYFSLIQTPKGMASYLGKDENGLWWHEKKPYLSVELLNYSKICGSSRLVEEYAKEIEEKLSLKYNNEETLRSYFAFRHLAEKDQRRFRNKFISEGEAGLLINVKKDFYSYPALIINRLALGNSIKENGIFNKIKALRQFGIIGKKESKSIEWLCSNILLLRLKTYEHYKRQREFIDPIRIQNIHKKEIGYFTLGHYDLSHIKKFYELISGLHRVFGDFLKGKTKVLSNIISFEDSDILKSKIDYRLFELKKIEKNYLDNNNKDKITQEKLFIIGKAFLLLSKPKEAIKIFDNLAKSCNSVEIFDRSLAILYQGVAYLEANEIISAKEIFEKLLSNNLGVSKMNSIHLGMVYRYLGLVNMKMGQKEKASYYFFLSVAQSYKKCKEDEYLLVENYAYLGDLFFELEDLKGASFYYGKAFSIAARFYGSNHPNTFHILERIEKVSLYEKEIGLNIVSVQGI